MSETSTSTSEQAQPAFSGPAWDYARAYYPNPEVLRDFELLAQYKPAVFEGYMALRQAACNTDESAALSPKMKELIILAIEIARAKTNPPPVGHALKAVEAGATPAEIAEVASLCIMIGGMLTYQEAGRYVMRAVDAKHRELHPDE
jgi:alkylhydroperoxidase/carboxymuconolactone decarboxylase family protein YurZ